VEVDPEEEDIFMGEEDVKIPFLSLLSLYAIFITSRMTQKLFRSWMKLLRFFKVEIPMINVRKMFTDIPALLEENGVRKKVNYFIHLHKRYFSLLGVKYM